MRNIVVIAMGFLGDTLLIEPMLRNIKNNFNNANLILIVKKDFEDLAQGFESVDKVYSYDYNNKHKGIFGFKRFCKYFCEKNDIDISIITHVHERSVILAKKLGSKKIISLPLKNRLHPLNLLITDKYKYVENEIRTTYKADYNNRYLKSFCEDVQNYKLNFNVPATVEETAKKKFESFIDGDYTVLAPNSKDEYKDWDFDNILQFVKNSPGRVVLTGTQKTKLIAERLKEYGLDFVDLTSSTSLLELAVVLKFANIVVSVDTGTFHFAYACGVPVVALFYISSMVDEWCPKLDKVKVVYGKRKRIGKNLFTEECEISYIEVLKALGEMEGARNV